MEQSSGYKRLIFSFFAILLGLRCVLLAQPVDTLRLDSLFSIPHAINTVEVDIFNHVYAAAADGFIYKYDSTGRQLAVYSNNRFGPPDALYATSNRQLCAWYSNIRTLRILDRLLTPVAEFDLQRLGLSNCTMAFRAAYDGQFWVYDQWDYKLKKIDETGKLLTESVAMSLDFPGFSPVYGTEIGASVLVADRKYGIFVFNSFGGLELTLPKTDISNIFADENRVFYTIGKRLEVYNYRFRTPERSFSLPVENATFHRRFLFVKGTVSTGVYKAL